MANCRKQQGEGHHQVGHWRSSYNRKPPLGNKWHSTVPAWERKFCTSIGSVPWRKLVESKKYMHLFEHVVNWDDSAGKEAFDNAKTRYWAEINGVPCNISPPDPNIFIDEVDWNATVDPQLILDVETELAKVPNEELRKNDHEIVMIGGALFLNEQKLPCTGWDDDYAAEGPKPFDPNSAVQGWGENLQEHNGVESGKLNHAPAEHAGEHVAPAEPAKEDFSLAEPAKEDFSLAEHAKGHEWQDWRNDSWGWNQRENYGGGGGGDLHKMGRGRNGGGGYGNWGTWDGYNRRRENNMSWSKTPSAYNGNNEYHVNNNRGRRNYRGGGRRGNFVYVPKEVPPTPTHAGW
ncbi:hypothetical protein GLYMA_03G132800v4 [Glycine max]|uniref:Uncharacterized protein n=2 Tax=Glycine subgen. Soja TaxID=1462606 RepID=I1JN94_SOYBN|nr:uncharacterized protein LOC100794939 [Glycine max]XP_028225246.1 uncharacterized protein LOC114406678 [Glycine soja]KAG5043303.1 hypothetical protein JHK87_007218 [Glycine soja]KAG5055087.1 hypothetical protein JHK85_007597 [Glycine max]KAH1258040.1 hypothetical protein GmHk_03G007873 [Glycine max]KHN07329.1 hypothetical protein glysoja_012627 [Glycine soja]KRH66847.1 hypothetical protein GLYMA_03G132800v4 [Glycine max]|eukprot:XP_003521158.1 uncharacterized protein LOC100794939 [Glycine max]